jgi:hypothetical protein
MSVDEPRLGGTEDAQVRRAPKPKFVDVHREQPDARVAGERELDEREVTEDREISDDERFEMFVAQHMQSVLPNLPHHTGHHVCWLTTGNARDSIPNRLRAGYRLLRTEDVPGWDGIASTAGDKSGIVCVNEMVAAEIPLRLYNRYMRYMHYDLPLKEEEKLRAHVGGIKAGAEEIGAKVVEGDGTANIVQRAAPMPEFDS